jgi:hypothetical protein
LRQHQKKLNRRTLVAGGVGILAGILGSKFSKTIKKNNLDLDRSYLSDSKNIDNKSFENTLNPKSQLGENLANAVDYNWRIAIPYENAQHTVDITVRSEGISIVENLKLKAGEKPDINTPIFVGPDKKLYCYLYGIPTNDRESVEVNIGDKRYNISLKSIVPQVDDRTGLFLLEEEITQSKENILLGMTEILENAEILLPFEDKFTVWIPKLDFPGTTVLNVDRIGIVLSQEQILQENLLASELPYILGKSILPIYFSPFAQKNIKQRC